LKLQFARYRFHWRVTTPLQLPPYASSTLRGVFGHALRHLACLTRAASCKGCALLANCPYPRLFEPQRVPQLQHHKTPGMPASAPALAPYAIETPFTATGAVQYSRHGPGEQYSFDMVLMNPAAINQLPLIIAAWQRAFALGVGPQRGRAELVLVEHLAAAESNPVCSATRSQIQCHDTTVAVPPFLQAENVKLQLLTPLRIEQQGKLIKAQDMTAGIFLRHLIRRVSFHASEQQAEAFRLADIHQFNALADQVHEGERCLHWHDWERYSSRQDQKMKLGGLIGHWQLLDVPPALLTFIYLGQWLHVGKECAFGLGQYRWLKVTASH
jgi:hypothetical protein